MKLDFAKVHGAGNDFVVFKHPEQPDEFFARIAPSICNRRKGVGADGILLVRKEPGYDFRMVYFNADGSRAEFCGNGARSLVLYAWKEGIAPSEMKFISDAGVHQGLISDGNPSVSLPNPAELKLNISLPDFFFPMHFVNTGVPHVVVFVDNVKTFDVIDIGSQIRYHKYFAPKGTNVNFVQVFEDGKVSVRTYERGVESETLACGTGAVAVAAVLAITRGFKPPVKLDFPGGALNVDFNVRDNDISDVMLGGETAIVFKGEIEIV
ncbi:diaminopimelate epimerase [bacterium]|nr:diaminopimelate epimerase [bacterium]